MPVVMDRCHGPFPATGTEPRLYAASVGRYRVSSHRRWALVLLSAAWTLLLFAAALAGVIHVFAFLLGLVLSAISACFAWLDWRSYVEVDQRGITVVRWKRSSHPWAVVRGVSGRDGWALEIIDGDDITLPDVDDFEVLLDTIALAIGADRGAAT